MAQRLGPGHTIVTILAESRQPYHIQALQSGIPAREGIAAARLLEPAHDRAAVRDDAYLRTATATSSARRRKGIVP